MSALPTSPLPPDLGVSDEVLHTLLEVSLAGVILFRPVYSAAGDALTDLAYEYLNPAAQQLLGLPQRPAASFLTYYPAAAAAGIFAFYRDAFLSGQVQRGEFNFQHDGLDGYFHLVARRQGALLLVSFTDTGDAFHAAEQATLRRSQSRAVAARAAAEQQRSELERVFEQAPVAIAVYRGPRYVIELANPTVCRLWGRQLPELIGRPLFEALPEVAGMGYEELLDQVMATGKPYLAREMPAVHEREGRRDTVYWDFVYVPMYEEDGRIYGAMVVATEVTEQVVARQQVQLLNQALEVRVAERTQQLAEALRETERQREQLQVQQGRLSQILGQVPAAIATLSGPEHRFSFFNTDYQAIVAGRATLGQRLADAVPEVVEQGFVALLDNVLRTGQPFVSRAVPARLYEPSTGSMVLHYVDLSYQQLVDAHGQATGILAFIVDVTEGVLARKQAETLQAAMLAVAQRQAQQREEVYQVLKQAPTAMLLLRGPAHRIEYYNPAYAHFFAGQELLGRPFADAHPEALALGLTALLDQVYRTGETYVGHELALQLPGDQPPRTRYFNYTFQAYRENERVAGVSVFATEATEQVLARRQRDAQQQMLQRLFEEAPAGIAILAGPTFVFELANAHYQRFLPARPLLGQAILDAVPELAQSPIPTLLRHVYDTGETHVEQGLRVLLPAPDGEQQARYFTFVYQPRRDERGAVNGVLAFVFEVTDQVLAREQVQQLNATLATTNEALQATNQQLTRTNTDLDTFVYTASHDLKSPITNIEGLLTALRGQLPASALAQPLVPRILALMEGAVARFQATLGHLTTVSQLQYEQDQPAEAIDLPALVEAVRLDMLPELTAAAATLELDIASCPPIHFSVKNLRSIIYNLLSNAVKYRAPDRAPLVQLRCHRAAAGQVVLAVRDNGLGLTPTQQQEAFRMFRRLHTHVAGTGVGLYMVKRLVENAGGTITLHSEPGVGSTFTVSLPAGN